MKRCPACKTTKPITEFSIRRASPDGRNGTCKACACECRDRWYQANRTKAIERSTEWRKNNRDKYREWQKRYQTANRDKIRDIKLQQAYGITIQQYNSLLAVQGGRCACCGSESPGNNRRFKHFAVDHDQRPGRVSGLLCNSCNLAIGKLGDDICSLLNAVDYLYRAQREEDEADIAGVSA